MSATRIGAGVVFAALTLAGCATSFSGEPHVQDGRTGCEKKCSENGMSLAGMVYMGEYSDACVCEVKGGSASSGRQMLVGSAGAGGGAAGVWMQMEAARQRQQQQMMMPPGH